MPAKGSAEWKGDVPTGAGTFTAGDTISGEYSYKSRFEDGPGANPEQLIAAAEAKANDLDAEETSGGPLVEPEADLHGDLEVTEPVVLDAAAHPGDLEPVQVVQGLRSAAHRALDRVVDAVGRGADDLGD